MAYLIEVGDLLCFESRLQIRPEEYENTLECEKESDDAPTY